MLDIKIGHKPDMMVHIFQSQHFGDRDREISEFKVCLVYYSEFHPGQPELKKKRGGGHILTAFEIQRFLLHFIASAFKN